MGNLQLNPTVFHGDVVSPTAPLYSYTIVSSSKAAFAIAFVVWVWDVGITDDNAAKSRNLSAWTTRQGLHRYKIFLLRPL